MKYDCSKTIDCIHEFRRRCDSIGCNYACPFWGTDNCNLESFDEDEIALLQKWSDEHPEIPKLSRKERDFLDYFCGNQSMAIERVLKDRLYVRQYSPVYPDSIMIDPNLFPFIEEGKEWYFDELLKLEVIE